MISVEIKPLQLAGQAEEFKFGSKYEPLQVIWQFTPKAVLEGNLRFAKTKRLGQHSSTALASQPDKQTQTLDVSKFATVTMGSNSLHYKQKLGLETF